MGNRLKSKPTPYREWLLIHREPPPILYHYTTAQGLVGILESGLIWATNSRFLNDLTEIEYATRLFRRVALDEIDRRGSKLSFQVAAVRGWITNSLDYYEEEAKVYLSCFCANGDLLSQWRGYGASGGGYAIGFKREDIPRAEIAPNAPPEFIMRKVIYQAARQDALIRYQVNAACDSTSDAGEFSLFFSECLNCFKDAAFEEEGNGVEYSSGALARRIFASLSFASREAGSLTTRR